MDGALPSGAIVSGTPISGSWNSLDATEKGGVTRRREYWVMEACWARDGDHLAVMRYLRDGRANSWYVALDGSSAEELISPRPSLTWSFPCGSHLPVVAGPCTARRPVQSTVLLDMESRKEQQLTSSLSHRSQAAWSPTAVG